MKQNQHQNLQKLTLTALLTAFTTVATLIIQIPSPTKGYVNLGDCLVNISAWILGPAYGAAAAGIGSALADLISGHVIFVPATLIIKALMAVASYFVYQKFCEKSGSFRAGIIASCVAEIIMGAGYTLFEAVVMYGSLTVALVGLPGDIAQGIMGMASSVAVYELVLKRIPHLHFK